MSSTIQSNASLLSPALPSRQGLSYTQPSEGAGERERAADSPLSRQRDNEPPLRQPLPARANASLDFENDPQLQQILAERQTGNDNTATDRRTQRALQAFADNSPSVEERLGIELVGVDTFA